MDFNSFFNKVLGDNNVFIQDSNGNSIHIGDIIYDKVTNKRSVKCPNCGTSASEETKEETNNYIAFTCVKCYNRFFEHDEVAQNISSYVDLTGQEAREFERLIEAVNHDLHVGDINYAYDRCRKNKEVYGKTPQIYEWGAFTLFLTQDVTFWVKHSINGVIAYLDKSRQLDKNSPTYDRIAASIATRYYQGVMAEMEHTKQYLPARPQINKKEMPEHEQQRVINEYNEVVVSIRKEVFKYLKQVEVCYQIYPDIDFIKIALSEFYGYNGVAWYEKKFASFFSRPIDHPNGGVKLLKGYVWDFHKIVSNSDSLFEDDQIKPSDFVVKLELILRKAENNFDFPEIRVGNLDSKSPLSALASLNLFQISTYACLALITIILWLLKWKWSFVLFLVAIVGFIYKKDKDGNNPDRLRRLTNKNTNLF